MKYKVGDKVAVVNLIDNGMYDYPKKASGAIAEIVEITSDVYPYVLDYYFEGMILSVKEEEIRHLNKLERVLE